MVGKDRLLYLKRAAEIQLDLFVTVQILEDTLAVLSLGKLSEEHGYSYEWASGQKTTANHKWQNNSVQYGTFRGRMLSQD